jgi:aryl-alcohol dehydrogenase-like predicted oxidoreductase
LLPRHSGRRPGCSAPHCIRWPTFSPLQHDTLNDVAARLESSPQQVALAWLLQRSATTVLIPGTSSVAHLRENVAAADLELSADAVAGVDSIGK